MAKSKYAHFFVLKMLRYGNKDQKKLILKQMEGNIAKVKVVIVVSVNVFVVLVVIDTAGLKTFQWSVICMCSSHNTF